MFTSRELRKKYIDFFTKHGHAEVESSSTIPHKDDQTVLFTTAGMQQFVPNLMGQPHPKGTRLSSVQKCVRTVDIDEVGDNRHLTLFEMLGNWSLGDYFKKEALEWSWQFLTQEAKIDPERIWVTVFGGDKDIPLDTEAETIWLDLGVPKERIIPIGPDPKNPKKGRGDNFWGPAGKTGPCGPCSEMHIWIGEGQPKEGQNPANDDTNFVEVWNDVFMEFMLDENGNLSKLAKQNVDTGMGLERLTMILNNKKTVFETDVYAEILEKIEKISGKKYPPYPCASAQGTEAERSRSQGGDLDEKNPTTRAFRVIADHIRTATHIIADGVAPSNEGRGYVLRRLIRRAVRYGAKLGITETFLSKISSSYIEAYSCFYPEIKNREQLVFSTLTLEEEQFLRTLERGEKIFEELAEKGNVTGKDAFTLFDTYGFPFDLTRELAEERGFVVDEAEFEAAMKEQRERSRANKNFDRKGSENAIFDGLPATEFVGYETLKCEAKILKMVRDGESACQNYRIVFDKTPFYAESGGQVGDRGVLQIEDYELQIIDVKKLDSGVFVHYAVGVQGFVPVQNENSNLVQLEVDGNLRAKTARHHSAAHLLQSALIKVLGDHIEQAGSLVDENRTRFDFTHPKALSIKEILEVQKNITSWILGSHPVSVKTMPIGEAKEKGAVALFSEKYGETVRTIEMGEVSFELCGGTHVQNTSEIGAVQIISETSVSSGIRRIEMVVGPAAQELLDKTYLREKEISERLKCTPVQILERIEKLFSEKKEQENIIRNLEKTIAETQAQMLFEQAENGVLEKTLEETSLPKTVNIAKALIEKGLVQAVLTTPDGGIVVATAKNGPDAREIFKQIQAERGGNGGGSPTLVQGKGVKI